MPDKPKEKPSYEDIEREMGLDMMSFFSDMVRPDQHEERDDDPVFRHPRLRATCLHLNTSEP